jgi:drug/metabolite transporter (DMT)-like permease
MALKGYLYTILAAAMWGMIGPFARIAFQEGVSPMEVAFWRAVLAWLFFGTHAVLHRQVRFRRGDLPALAAFSFAGVACFYGLYQTAISRGGVALAAVLLYTAPAWVAVMSRIVFKEAMTPTKLAALVLTSGGVIGISLGTGNPGLGDGVSVTFGSILIGLAAGFCFALFFMFGKHFSGRYTSPNLFLYALPLGSLGLYPFVTFVPKTPTAWAALVMLGFLCTYCSYYCYYLGVQHLEATRSAITATLEPVVAAVVAFLWWGEYFSLLGYAGSLLILASVVLIIRERAGAPAVGATLSQN